MVKLIIDALIDNYERKLTTSREELARTSDALKAAYARRDETSVETVELLKQVTQLKRDLSAAQLDKLRTMDHLIAAVSFISEGAAGGFSAEGRAALRDALYAIPANAVTTGEQANIDALVKALDKEGASANAAHEEAISKEVALHKHITLLTRERASALEARDTARFHVQAALACIPVEDVPSYDAETRAVLRDAIFYAEPGAHIDALTDAIDKVESPG